jgi:hypothetical protein
VSGIAWHGRICGDVGSAGGLEGRFQVAGGEGHNGAPPVGERDGRDSSAEWLCVDVAGLAGPASAGEALPYGGGDAWAGPDGSGPGGDVKMFLAADCVADVTGHAVAGHDTEPHAWNDRHTG